jgi:hypothetical protein
MIGIGISIPMMMPFAEDATAFVRPGVLRAPFVITRAQLAGVQSSAVNGTNDGLTFYGADVPRFTGSAQRLLIEGQGTNLINNMAAPVTQNVTVTAAAHTLTLYGTGSITLSGVATGTLNGTGANNRVALTFTPTAGTLTLTVSGTVTRAQLEVGGFATSYVEVSSGAATRGADTVTASLSSLGIAANGACTVLSSCILPQLAATSGADHRILHIDDGTGNNGYQIRNFSGSNLNGQRVTGGVTTGGLIGNLTANVLFRVGMTIDGAGRVAFSLNGATPLIVTGGPTTGLTSLRVGINFNSTFFLWGEIERFRVLPYSVSDAELQFLVGALP